MSDKFDVDSWNPSKPAPGLPTVRELMARRADATSKKQRNAIDALAAMVEAIKLNDHFDAIDKSGHWVEGFYRAAVESGRYDDEIEPNDPNDHATRGRRGANNVVAGDPDVMPDVDSMDLRACKAACLSIGAWSSSIREQLASALITRLRELGAGTIADRYSDLWSAIDLEAPSDQEANETGAAHGDDDDDCDCDEDDEDCDCDEERDDDLRAAQLASATKARAQLATPSRATAKRDARKARSK